MSSTSITSKIGATDLNLATGGTGAAETFDRETSTGGTLTQDKIDAAHIKFRTLAKSINDLVDGGKDIHLKPSDITMGGTLTVDAMSSAGYVKNSAAGVLSGGNAIVAADLPAASTTAQGAVELATDAEAQTGTDTARAITPANLQAVTGTETRKGVLELATAAEVQTGTDTARACTPAGVSAARFANDIIQIVHTQTTAGDTSTTQIPLDGTIPTSSEGEELVALATTITPTSATNKLFIEVCLYVGANGQTEAIAALFQDSGAASIATMSSEISATGHATTINLPPFYMLAGTTSATTFKIRYGPSSAVTLTANPYFSNSICTMTITEIKV